MSLIRYYSNAYPDSLDQFFNDAVKSLVNDFDNKSSRITNVKSYSGDVKTDDESTTITVEMPGVSVENLDVSVNEHVLKISGKSRTEKEYKYSYVLNPAKHDEDNVKAVLKDGILEVQVPHAPQSQPKTIKIMTS